MPAPAHQLLYCATVLFKVLYCKIKNISLTFYVCLLCIICAKSIINLLQYSIYRHCVSISWIPRLISLDKWNSSVCRGITVLLCQAKRETLSSCLTKVCIPNWEDLVRGFIAVVQAWFNITVCAGPALL